MCEDFHIDHISHDKKWIYSTDHMVACVACIVQTIEDPQISHLRKSPSIALLTKLVQIPTVLQDLKSDQDVTYHIIHVILDALLQTDDTTFISAASDACLKLVQSCDSEDIIDFILQDVESKMEVINSHKELLPLYLLLGRLVQKFSELSDKFLQHYEQLITKLCTGLCCPEEDVQSAILFIMVYIFEGRWEDFLSPRQLTQLCEDLVCMLNSAKTQILMMNSLGLLAKLLLNERWTNFIMTLTVDGTTLLAVLKKMVACTIEVVQQLAIQIMSCIIQRDNQQAYSCHILQTDLLEFLFEKLNTRNTQNIEHILKCLLPLSHMEQFYSRNHSVYGIEVLLKTLHTLKTMNHYVLTKKIIEIIGIIFDRQPSKSPLFVNSTTLKLCLDIIISIVEHSHPGVFAAALKMTKAFLRKEHMLRPVPVSDLKTILQKMTGKVQIFVCETELFEKQKSKTKVSDVSSVFCEAMLAASRLVMDCKRDPSTCMSAFLAPDAVDNNGSTIESLGELVVTILSQNSISLAVSLLDNKDSPDHCCLLFQLLSSLQQLDQIEHKNIVSQLTCGGMLSKAVNIRCSLRDCHTNLQHVDPCLLTWCLLLYQEENKDDPCPGELEISIDNIFVRLDEVANYLTHSCMSKDTVFLYSFLLYHCYKNDDLILPCDELMFVLDTFSKDYDNASELSPFVKKQFVFLWAMLTCMTENVVGLPTKGLQTVVKLIDSCPSSVWYTHHPAVLNWSFKDSRITKICGQNVLSHWLNVISLKDGNHHDVDTDITILYHMFTDEDFISILLACISRMNGRTAKLVLELFENYILQMTDSDEKGVFLLTLSAITEDKIVEIFLNAEQKPEVTSWLDDDKEEPTILYCLQLLSGAMSYHPARVVNLMVNSYKFIALINSLLTSAVVQLQNASWNILSLIILHTKGLNEKVVMTVELTINPVGEFVQNINTVTPYLQVLSALLQVDFTCPIVSLKNTGRYPQHMACPFTTKDFKVLFIYLQQLVLQDINDVKSTAVQCIEDMFRYLKTHSFKLVSDLLKCSWNSILLEVLITITASDLSSLQTTLQLIDVVLELDQNETIFKNSNLHQHLVDFIKCIDIEDTTNHATLSRIRNKIL
ncbi:Hypothetical predicted protein [Mytilus galloprovincialis]|uniref:Uncharacterized protein n=1 Tax=Mytilus galloprovincialis TaxID=29158 RepID=A0A8B6GIW0_MYTGA|nr:Hypothetical predicted protein [Mytilus galloprovincialis]